MNLQDLQNDLDGADARDAIDALEMAFEEATSCGSKKQFWARIEECRKQCDKLSRSLPTPPKGRKK